MKKKEPSLDRIVAVRRYESPNIPLAAIRKFARAIGERFKPEKIILFGSYSRGEQHQGSDVDLLVVMPTKNETSQAIRIRMAFALPFALDLIVRTPENLARRLKEEDWFLREIIETGKVVYEESHEGMGEKGRGGLGKRKRPLRAEAAK